MSFKRSSFDNDNGGSDSDAQPFHKRQRFDDGRGRGRGGRGRGDGFRGGRGDGFRGGRGDGFRGGRGGGGFRGGRGGFNRFNNDDNEGGFQDRRGRGGFRGGGDRFNRDSRGGGGFRGRGRGGRFDGGRGRGRGGGRGDFRGGRGGGFRDRSFNDNNNNSIIKVQQDAPDFQNILNDKSENVSLKQYKGQYVVLFIYFKDGTYGCSAEQKAFRDLKEQFDKHNAVILGVSRDDAETHKSAVAEANLNFSLLADTDSKITKSYGALDDSDRVTRCTFIIGPDGKIAAVWGKVFGFNEHAQQVLDKLKEITSGGQGKSGDDNDNDNDNDNDDDDNNDDNDNDNDNNDDDDDDE